MVEPLPATKEPAGALSQKMPPVPAANEPGAHGVHADAPPEGGEKEPAAQGVAAVAELPPVNDPPGALVQLVAPFEDANAPGAHGVHADAPPEGGEK